MISVENKDTSPTESMSDSDNYPELPSDVHEEDVEAMLDDIIALWEKLREDCNGPETTPEMLKHLGKLWRPICIEHMKTIETNRARREQMVRDYVTDSQQKVYNIK